MIKFKAIKDRSKEIILNKGYLNYKIQFSKPACKYLVRLFESNLDKILIKAVDLIIEQNNNHSRKKKKRITVDLLQKVLFKDTPSDVSLF